MKGKVVLFDLDGTLADTASDLFRALQRLCTETDNPPPSFDDFRRIVSLGSTAMVQLAFAVNPRDPPFESLRERLLHLYSESVCETTELFPGVRRALASLHEAGCGWGVVTNKPGWLTEPLLTALSLDPDPACIVSGDTLERRKPHPDQLLFACQQIGVSPEHCVYVGDARTDIEAGQRAKMRTIAASYGYIPSDEHPGDWGADALIASGHEIFDRAHALLVPR